MSGRNPLADVIGEPTDAQLRRLVVLLGLRVAAGTNDRQVPTSIEEDLNCGAVS